VVRDLERYTGLSQSTGFSSSETPQTVPDALGGGIRKRIDFMASHMFHQLKEHEEAQRRTGVMFEQLLCQLEESVVTFQQSFLKREVPVGSIYAKIDADRSVGILYLLWHTVSFTTRGNTKPMAMSRNGREPLFTGRIVALIGDYQDNVSSLHSQDYPEVLEDELASLYIPASPVQPVVMKFSHKSDELFFNQGEATQQFLLKILEAICGGGFFHESPTQP
jgi:hypothetical protein